MFLFSSYSYSRNWIAQQKFSQFIYLFYMAQEREKYLDELIRKRYQVKQSRLDLYYRPNDWKDLITYLDCWEFCKVLKINSCEIMDSDISIIAGMQWPELDTLFLDRNKITSFGILNLFKNQFPKLKQITLSNNKIMNQGLAALISRQQFKKLRFIFLRECHITWKGLQGLSGSRFTEIKSLGLGDNNIGSKGVKLLVKADLPALNALMLDGCRIGNSGFKCLAKQCWPKLCHLKIHFNRVAHDGYSSFNQGNWRKLGKIWVGELNTIEPIYIIRSVISDWKKQIEIEYSTGNNWKKEIKQVLSKRFIR